MASTDDQPSDRGPGPVRRFPVPGFIVIGAMKAGTTTLHRWLESHPDVATSPVKELDVLHDPDAVARGRDEYLARLPVGAAPVVGESSPAYLSPAGAPIAAATVASWFPTTPLLAVLREPTARARSHHAHQVQRSREKRSLAEAIRTPGNPYVAGSRYAQLLAPYFDAGVGGRLLVTSLERLTGDDGTAWRSVLDHLGLEPIDRPSGHFNATAEKEAFTPAMRAIYDRGLHRFAGVVPRPLRRLARRVLLRPAPTPTVETEDPFDEAIREELARATAQLVTMLGVERPPWEPRRRHEDAVEDAP